MLECFCSTLAADSRAHGSASPAPSDDQILAGVAADQARAHDRRRRRGRGRGHRGGGRRGRGAPAHDPLQAEDDDDVAPPPAPSPPPRAGRAPPLHTHLEVLQALDLEAELRDRVYTFQSAPRQLRGLLRNAFRVGLEHIRDAPTQAQASTGWKLFLLAPRMLLYRAPGAGQVPPEELRRREKVFLAGQWLDLLREAASAAQQPPRTQGRATTTQGDEEEEDLRRRAERAGALAHLGELSAAAKALTALPLAPTTRDTLNALRDPARRPPEPQVPVEPRLRHSHAAPVELSPAKLVANASRARKGAAPGPSGCTSEHLRVLLDDEECTQLLTAAASKLARAEVPEAIVPAIRLGRMVALTKPSGGVRALVMGDAFRRLVARTLAQQLHEEFQSACAPFQYALSTKAGAEALVRAIRASTESDPRTTVLSVDGVGAYDHISRQSMLSTLADRPALAGLLPYAALFYGAPSTYVFYDAEGHAHDVQQGEGGEQGDPLMPSMFALGQHQALLETRARLHPSNALYAFPDDIYVTGPPEHTVGQFAIVREALARHANIQVHLGKTRAWNSAGEEPPGLLEVLPPQDPENPCWTGNWALPAAEQGVVVLGSPVGSRDFIAAKLAQRLQEQDRLLSRIPRVPELQSAWLLLLYCAAPRSTYLLRTLPPADTAVFAAEHDAAIRRCLATLLAGGDGDMPLPDLSYRRAQLPLSMGGLGLGSAERLRHAAYWSSWADTVRALRKHQPGVLAALLRPLQDASANGTPPSTRAAEQAARFLRSEGFSAPTWARLLEEDAAAPAPRTTRSAPGARPGWQCAASKALDKRALEMLFNDIDPTSRALLLSQAGDAASCAFTALPTSADTRVPDSEYRVMLLRRLRATPTRPKALSLRWTLG